MNKFLSNNIPSMEVEELSLDDISLDQIKNNFSKLTKDSPNLIHESRLAVKVSESDFTNFSERLRSNKIEMFEIEKPNNKFKI